MIFDLLGIMAPVLACAALGFIWERRGLPYNTREITPLIVNIGTPALVVSTLLNTDLTLDVFLNMFGYALCAIGTTALVGLIILKLFRQDIYSFLPALTFPNAGNMGLSICFFAFGDIGLALGIAYFCVASIGQFTIGAAIASGQLSFTKIATSPLVWGIACALALIGTGTTLPVWAMNTIDLIGGFVIPLMLIGLGVSLARLKVSRLGISLFLSAVRIGGGFLIGWGVTEVFALEGILRGIVIIQTAMPVALFNYLFASYYNRDAEGVAGMVVISTVMSFLTLPALLWFALQGV